MREKRPEAPPSDGSPAGGRRKWSNIMPLLVFLVVVGEITLLGRLDVVKNAAMVDSWAHSFYPSPSSPVLVKTVGEEVVVKEEEEEEWVGAGGCEEWLEKADALNYTRDFGEDPVFVYGGEQEDWKSCSVGCKFGHAAAPNRKPDASFSLMSDQKIASVHRSMESAHYYPENNLAKAHRRGFTVVMTTSLSSDVPVGYFSWAEYDIMAPVIPKTEKAHAAAFISNCGARNFRLEALVELEKLNIKIDSYGACHRNRAGQVDKVQALKRYKFSLAFENSNEEDYVTEKFFQSLVAGTIPVVVGAPNILDFAPSLKSVLHINELSDVVTVAKKMKYLAENAKAYNDSLRWKYEGPSDSFKAVVDMAAVHSSCRLCIFLATKIREHEERSNYEFQNRPCKCTRGLETIYHLFVRERGRFEFESIFLRSRDLTLKALESAITRKFKSLDHKPVWKEERPHMLRGTNQLKIHRIYPIGMTQRQALFMFKFDGDEHIRQHIKQNPCAKFEVIFV